MSNYTIQKGVNNPWLLVRPARKTVVATGDGHQLSSSIVTVNLAVPSHDHVRSHYCVVIITVHRLYHCHLSLSYVYLPILLRSSFFHLLPAQWGWWVFEPGSPAMAPGLGAGGAAPGCRSSSSTATRRRCKLTMDVMIIVILLSYCYDGKISTDQLSFTRCRYHCHICVRKQLSAHAV